MWKLSGKSFSFGLRGRLLFLVVLAVAPALGLMLLTAEAQRRIAAREVEAEAMRIAHLAAAQQEHVFEGARQLIEALAQLPQVRGDDLASASRFFSTLLDEFPRYENIGLLSPSGQVKASGIPVDGDVNLSYRPYFQRALQTRDFSVGDYQIGRITGKPTLNLAYPIVNPEGQVEGVIFAAMNLVWLSQLISQVRLPESSAITVVDSRGTILARHPDPEQWVGKALPDAELIRAILTRHEGVMELHGVDEMSRLYSFTPLRGSGDPGLYLSAGLSKQVQFAKADLIFMLMIAGLGVVGLVAIAAAWFMGNALVVHRVRAVVAATRRLRAGDIGVRTGLVRGNDELGQLATAFDEMAESLERRDDERRTAERALRESEERYRSLVEISPDALIIYSDGRVVFVNPAAVRLSGASSAEQLIGRPVMDLVHPDSQDRVRSTMSALDDGPSVPKIMEKMVRLDGKAVEVEAVAVPFHYGGRPAVQVIARDVSERKSLEEQFRQAQKMEAVGRLAGGVAHDFNNLLTAIMGYASFLRDRLGPEHPCLRDVVEIHKAGTRAANLTRQLLAFSRQQVVEPRILDLNGIISDLDKMLRRLLREDIELVTAPATGLGRVKADPGQMEQVIVNLAVNARDAMQQGGKLTVETANIYLGEEYVRHHFGTHPGHYVMLAVSDTGCGINAETKARIFEPFFTTKEPGKGTGLGLSTVYGIVKQTGGHIEVYSEPGWGATFKIYIPRTDETAELAAPQLPPTTVSRGSETVLLVEDDALVRDVVRHALRRIGYSVTEAATPEEALRIYEQENPRIDLMITDTVMPGMSGPELVERLRSRAGNFKVIHMSGYTETAVLRHGWLDPTATFLQKPFTPDVLAAKIRELLDEPGNRAA